MFHGAIIVNRPEVGQHRFLTKAHDIKSCGTKWDPTGNSSHAGTKDPTRESISGMSRGWIVNWMELNEEKIEPIRFFF